jgi:hypothetical protein
LNKNRPANSGSNPELRIVMSQWFSVMRFALACQVLLLLSAPSIGGEIMYSSFGPGDTFINNGGYAVDGTGLGSTYDATAMRFETSESATLDAVRFAGTSPMSSSSRAADLWQRRETAVY